MTAIAEAQAATLDDARVTFLEARTALDYATAAAGRLHDARLLPSDLFRASTGALDGTGGVLDELIAAVTL